MSENNVVDFAARKAGSGDPEQPTTPADVLAWFTERMADEEFANNLDSVMLIMCHKNDTISQFMSTIEIRDLLLALTAMKKLAVDDLFTEF